MRRLEALRAAVVPWVIGRLLVLGALELARYLVDHLHPVAGAAVRAHEGLLGWDAGYYRDIAVRGYAALPRPALRFFPLVPIVTRGLHDVTGLSAGACLLVLVNGSALVAAALLYRLVFNETTRRDLARMSVWILALAPSAFVLVMGYAESVLILLSVAMFLALRSGRWWWAAAAGYLAGLTRPIGALLALAALGQVILSLRPSPPARPSVGVLVPRALAVAAPVAGCVTYLGWVAARFGDFWLPVRIQESGNLRGRFSDPVVTFFHDARQLFHAHVGTGLHAPWLVVFVVLLVVCFRRWPLPYGLYAVGVVGLAVSSSNFDSLERYGLSAFPLVLAAASLVRGEEVQRSVLAVLGGLLVSYSLLAFLDALVP